MKKNFTKIIAVISVLALALCLSGCASQSYKDKAEVKANIACSEDLSSATAMKAAVYKANDEGTATEEKAIDEKEIKANEDIVLGELEAGKYVLKITQLPTLEDGSLFQADKSEIAFEVVKEDKADAKVVLTGSDETTLKATLTKVATDEMTEEQLEQAAATLEASGKSEAAASTKTKATEKASSSSSSSSSASSGSSSSSSSSSSSASSGSSSSGHTHTWVAQYQTVRTGSYILCSCGQTFSSQSAWSSHNKALGPGNGHSYSVKDTYEKQVVGYVCSGCGATK